MSSFLWGALGAATVLTVAALARRAAWRRFAHRRGPGARWVLRRIGATPEQERAVLAETDALAEALAGLREDARALRADLADLLAAPSLDAARVAAALDARLARTGEVRAKLAAAISRIHAALGAEQRERLAALVRSGPGHRCHRATAHAHAS